MIKKYIQISFLILFTFTVNFGQTSYTWIGGPSGNYTAASNWSPLRTNGQITDKLIYNSGSTVTVNNVQQQTIGQLIISNNTHVIFSAASGNPKIITINGGSGDDFVVDSNSTFEIYSNSSILGILIKTGATGIINGTVLLRGSKQHYLDCESSESLIFKSGSYLNQMSPGYIFTNGGTANAVKFENGSTFAMQNIQASTPFGLIQPNSKVIFYPYSIFLMQCSNPTGVNLNGRSYGNFILDMNSNLQIIESFSSNVSFHNFIINNGTELSITNNNNSFVPSLNISGNCVINGNFSFSGNYANNFKLTFNGSELQTISGAGIISFPTILESINFNNPVGITLNKDISTPCPVNVNGKLNLIGCKLIANVTILPGADFTVDNAFVEGKLTKNFSNVLNTKTFEVGTENGYSPVTITFNKITQEGSVSVKPNSTTQPNVEDSTKSLKRYWTINNNNIVFYNYSAILSYLSNDFNTNFLESRDEENMNVKSFFNGGLKNFSLRVNLRDTLNNKIGVTDLNSFGDLTMIRNTSSSLQDNFVLRDTKNKDYKLSDTKSNHSKNGLNINLANNNENKRNGDTVQNKIMKKGMGDVKENEYNQGEYKTPVQLVKKGMGDLKENEYTQGEYKASLKKVSKGMGDVKETEYMQGEYKAPIKLDKKGMGDLKENEFKQGEYLAPNQLDKKGMGDLKENEYKQGEYEQQNQSVKNGMGDLKEIERSNVEDNSNIGNLPNEFRISQNYPNPFNPSTKISYNLPVASNVTIKIFDINGRDISTLVNNSQEAGNYTVQYNAQNTSSGIYFYTINASSNQSNFVKTKKMILTK